MKLPFFSRACLVLAAFLFLGIDAVEATKTTVSDYSSLANAVNGTTYDTICVSTRITLPNGANLDGLYGDNLFKVIQVPVPYVDADGMQNSNPSPYGVFTIEKNSTVSLSHLVIMGGGRYPFNNTDDKSGIESNTYECGAIQNQGTLNMEYCTVQRSFRGIRNHTGGQLVMKYCKLIRNVCKFGSGVLNEGDKAQNRPDLGAADTKVVMDCCSFSENYAANDGGAAENKKGAVMFFNNTIMANNIGNISAINNWNGYLYFMNSTITGNVTTATKYDFAMLVGYGMWAVNSILTDNKTINGGQWNGHAEGEVNQRADNISVFTGCHGHLYHCIHGAEIPASYKGAPSGSEQYVYTHDCKVNQGVGQDVFQDYLETGIYLPSYRLNQPTYPKQNFYYFEGPLTSLAFKHSALVNNANHTISAPASTTGLAATTGCDTYFKYEFDEQGKLKVYMGFPDSDDPSQIVSLGNTLSPDGGFTEAMKVTTYSDGTVRVGSATMGSSLPTDADFFTLTLKGLKYGTCKVNGASLYGDTYPEGTVLTVEIIPTDETIAPFTGWTATDKDGNPIAGLNGSTSKTLNITMNQRITLQPNFTVNNYTLKYDLDDGSSQKSVSYNSLSQPMTLPTPTRKFYTFLGWSGTDIDGITLDPVNIPTGSSGNKTYTAHWEAAYNPVVNPDPEETASFYGTFYYADGTYRLPDGVYAYTASIDGDNMVLHRVANPGDLLPASTPVILKAVQGTADINNRKVKLPYISDGTPITITADNDLRGVDADSVVNKLSGYKSTDTYYILSGSNESGSITGVGFYQWAHTKTIPEHKAYLRVKAAAGSAPARFSFDFSQAEMPQKPASVDNAFSLTDQDIRKELRDGQLVIVRGEDVYTIHGLKIQ